VDVNKFVINRVTWESEGGEIQLRKGTAPGSIYLTINSGAQFQTAQVDGASLISAISNALADGEAQ
jgi:hypothetical protein